MCGRIVGLGALPPTDANNPAPALQDRPLCGIAVLDDLEWQNGSWRGSFYEPRNGTNYTISVTPLANGAVRVTGYSGQPVLSRTLSRGFEVWERITEPAASCGAATTS